ncbi:MAG: hypothetical protein NXI12_09155 [Alphaproteobacteria bacterium]|nr:hypothetical protein [Alphaproteobacteria bacterium]
MVEVALPDDLAFAPDDPHAALDGYAPEWPYRSVSLRAPRIYFVRVFHTQPSAEAEEAALNLGLKITEGRYTGLIMDYRGAGIDHDGQGFLTVADAFAANFPRELLIVYLHDRDTEDYATLMRGLLRAHGLKVARMTEFDRAWTAILDQLNNPAAQ